MDVLALNFSRLYISRSSLMQSLGIIEQYARVMILWPWFSVALVILVILHNVQCLDYDFLPYRANLAGARSIDSTLGHFDRAKSLKFRVTHLIDTRSCFLCDGAPAV